jgi:broad specificity phosphatase PhoE
MMHAWLIRHGSHDLLGRILAGRMPGIHLNEQGRREAMAVTCALRAVPLSAIYASPLERTLETAGYLAGERGSIVSIDAGFHEIDFGSWTGRTFEQLDTDPRWQEWNAHRGSAAVPGGEEMRGIQERAGQALQRLAARHSGEHVAVVSHGDVIRAVLASCLGVPLDLLHTIECDPGAVAHLKVGPGSVQLVELRSNDTLQDAPPLSPAEIAANLEEISVSA